MRCNRAIRLITARVCVLLSHTAGRAGTAVTAFFPGRAPRRWGADRPAKRGHVPVCPWWRQDWHAVYRFAEAAGRRDGEVSRPGDATSGSILGPGPGHDHQAVGGAAAASPPPLAAGVAHRDLRARHGRGRRGRRPVDRHVLAGRAGPCVGQCAPEPCAPEPIASQRIRQVLRRRRDSPVASRGLDCRPGGRRRDYRVRSVHVHRARRGRCRIEPLAIAAAIGVRRARCRRDRRVSVGPRPAQRGRADVARQLRVRRQPDRDPCHLPRRGRRLPGDAPFRPRRPPVRRRAADAQSAY